MALSKDKILKHAGSFKATPVHVSAWADEGGDDVVLVRGMTIREFELNQSRADDGQATASVIARCVVDENGGRVFDDADVRLIAELPMAQIQPLSKAILDQSGLGADADQEKAIEAAVGNSEAAQSGEPSSS